MISNSRARLLALPALALAGALAFTGVRAKADQWDKRTILTVDQPIQVRNTYLQPGTYVLKLLDSPSQRHVVQIFDKDQSRLIDTVMAVPNYRLQPTGDSSFAFWETPPGTVKALRAWFYPGDNFGQEFPYPKNLRRIETAQVITTTSPLQRTEERKEVAVNTTPSEIPEPAAAEPAPAEPSPAPAATASPSEPAEQPQEVAQATPAPQPAEQQPSPSEQQTAPATRTNELPRTAGQYPAMGMIGALALASFTALRRKSTASQ